LTEILRSLSKGMQGWQGGQTLDELVISVVFLSRDMQSHSSELRFEGNPLVTLAPTGVVGVYAAMALFMVRMSLQ
jgi:hypothetical protein